MRVLVVEDDAQLGDELATGLRQRQYVVDWFRDGTQASAALAGVPYDAVVLDLGLPTAIRSGCAQELAYARQCGTRAHPHLARYVA